MAATIKIMINSTESGGGIEKTSKDLKGMGDAAEKSGGGFTVMKGLAVNALTAVAGAALQAAAGVGKFLADSIGAAGDFESGMNTFASAAGNMGQAELGEFKDLFLSLGKELPVSTKEVQDAATAMVKGGIDPAVVAGGALKDTLLFAAAAGMELEGDANLTAKMLGTFVDITATAAEKTAFMAQSQELLVKAANASTVDVAQLGDAMLMAAGSAKAAGVPYDELVTTMGMISGAFPTAATAGTSFNNFLTRLIPQTNTAKEAMGELGLWTEETGSLFYDANGQFVGMEETARIMKDTFGDLTEAQLSEAMATIFGNDAKGAALELISKGKEGYDAFAASMANANGITATSAQTQQGFNFAMDNMKGSIEALQITVGMALLPTLTSLIGAFTTLINIGTAFAGGDMFTGFTTLGMWLTDNVNPALGGFVTNLAIATDPMQKLQDAILGFLGGVAMALPGQLQTWAQALGQWVLNALPGMGANLAAFAIGLYTQIGAMLPPLVAQLALWANAMVQWLITAIPPFLVQIGVYVATMLGFLQANLPAIVAQLGLWAAQFIAWLVDVIPKILLAGGDLVAQVINWLIASLPGFIENLKLWGKAFVDWLVETTPKVLKEAADLGVKLLVWIDSIAGDVIPLATSVGKNIVDGIAAGIASGAEAIKKAAISAATAALNAAKNALGIKSPSDIFDKQVGQPISEGIAQGIMAAGGSIQQALGGVLGNAMGSAQANIGISANPVKRKSDGGMSETIAGLVAKVGSGTTNNFNYTPTYSAVPNNPSKDFAAMRSLAGAGV